MADIKELSFVIPGYSPETIPLTRPVEYLQQVSVVLDERLKKVAQHEPMPQAPE